MNFCNNLMTLKLDEVMKNVYVMKTCNKNTCCNWQAKIILHLEVLSNILQDAKSFHSLCTDGLIHVASDVD